MAEVDMCSCSTPDYNHGTTLHRHSPRYPAVEGGAAVDGPNMADVLAAHRADQWSCSCGWPLNDSVGSWTQHLEAMLQPVFDAEVSRQVAAKEAERLATAWDEGHRVTCAYFPDCADNGHHDNPYRRAASEAEVRRDG